MTTASPRHGALLGLVLVAVSTTTACPPSTQGFCIDAARASCQLQFQCCTAVERQQLFGNTNLAIGPYSDEGGCVDVFTRRCEASSQGQDEAIAQGRLSFDSDRANDCVQKFKDAAAECDAGGFFNFDDDDDCDDLVSGEVKDGDACFSDAECKENGSECIVEQDVEGGVIVVTLEGTCKGQGDNGEPCLPGNACNEGLRCLQNPETFETACAPPNAAGGRCSVDDDCEGDLRCGFDENFNQVCTAPAQEGGACSQDIDCLAGLRCLQNASFAQVCQVPGGLGVQCNSNDECVPGLLCATDPVSFRQVCSTTSAQGEACPGGVAQCEPGLDCRFDGATNRCFAGQVNDPCDSGERCLSGLLCRNDPQQFRDTCQPPLGAGDDCDSFGVDVCDAALRCLQNAAFNFVCSPPLDADEPCTNSTDRDPCDATHHCAFDADASDTICVSRLSGNAVCADDVECGPGLFCNDDVGTCAARRNENQSCSFDADCGANLRCRDNDAGTGDICRALSDANEGCSALADCAPGLDCRDNDASSQRVCRGASVDGGACEGQGDCAAGLDCRQADDFSGTICRGVSGEDERCDSIFDCTPGLECRFDNASGNEVCKGPADAGEGCSVDGDCVDGLVCRFDNAVSQSVCSALLVVGDTCTSDGECTPGLRCRDLVPADEEFASVCTDKVDNGGACEADAECISGFCDNDGFFCGEPPPELDFEICDGL